jgi:hypothetical protein
MISPSKTCANNAPNTEVVENIKIVLTAPIYLKATITKRIGIPIPTTPVTSIVGR